MHFHLNQHELIIDIFNQMAKEKNKSVERIKRLLLVSQNPAINRRFWEILDARIPDHPYEYVGCCGECASFELR